MFPVPSFLPRGCLAFIHERKYHRFGSILVVAEGGIRSLDTIGASHNRYSEVSYPRTLLRAKLGVEVDRRHRYLQTAELIIDASCSMKGEAARHSGWMIRAWLYGRTEIRRIECLSALNARSNSPRTPGSAVAATPRYYLSRCQKHFERIRQI
jgi:hypothetical protein